MALRTEPWHVLELCAGAGGLGLGIKLAVPGAVGVAYVEREAAAAATLVTRMEAGDLATAPVWSDLASFDARPWRGRVHCVASGDPCQPNSVAGKGLGAADERFLIDQVLRIVDECRPLRLFRENVTGNAAGQLAALCPPLERMGFRVEAGIFSSAATGNSHGRERLVLMADREGVAGRLYPRPWQPRREAVDAGWCGLGLDDAERAEWRPDGQPCDASGPHPSPGGRIEGAVGAGASGPPVADTAMRGCDTGIDIKKGGKQRLSGQGGQALAGDRGSDMVDAECARRTASGGGPVFDAGSEPVPRGSKLADTDSEDVAGRRTGRDPGGREVEARHARLEGGILDPVAIVAPGPADPRWADLIAADPFAAPALGRFDFWAIARRDAGLPPLVDAIGRRGGLARDLDADATARLKSAVRRMADAMADRVERLRQLGNGVDPVVGWDAWVHLDARHRARRERDAADAAVT